MVMSSSNPLRAVVQRLNSTPVESLPRYAGFLAASILNCDKYLQTAESQKSDSSTVVHKLKTRILSLIQDKTQEGRYTGIVLAKAVIDAGGIETLSSSANWARSLISCLSKRDLPEVKSLCVVTIARILLLTKDHPSLVREITSPILPAFISNTLNLIRPLATGEGKTEAFVLSPLLIPVLQSWLQLVPTFATTFRPSIASIRLVMLRLLSEDTVPENVCLLAARVLAALHFSAPKNSSAAEWMQTCQQIIEAIHQASDLVLRSVIEEWTPIHARQAFSSNKKVLDMVAAEEVDAVGMDPWSGMFLGGSRIVRLLRLLETMLSSTCAQSVNIPIASILDVTARLTAVIIPNAAYSIRPNQDIGRDEREELWNLLPRLHEASLGLLNTITGTYGQLLHPVSRTIFTQVQDVFEGNPRDSRVRKASYVIVSTLLKHGLIEFVSSDTSFLIALVKVCCNDLTPTKSSGSSQRETNGSTQTSKNGVPPTNQQSGSTESSGPTMQAITDIGHAAEELSPLLFCRGSHTLPSSIRAQLDSAAILAGHKSAMLASVLNPAPPRKGVKPTPSILPFLARVDGESLGFEALVRPRMPIIQESILHKDTQANATGANDIDDADDQLDGYPDDESMGEYGNGKESKEERITPPVDSTPLLKKRDFGMIEQAITEDSASEPSKRSRIEMQDQDQTEQASHQPAVFSNLEESVDAALADSLDNVVGFVPLKPRVEASTIGQASTHILAKSSGKAEYSAAQADDSDDDEIPTIDTTLTSDDDEEEDEEGDAEMEEE